MALTEKAIRLNEVLSGCEVDVSESIMVYLSMETHKLGRFIRAINNGYGYRVALIGEPVPGYSRSFIK
jgi:hypothetical protein